jgi:hypothetical protein
MKARTSLFVMLVLLIASVFTMAFAPMAQEGEPGLTEAQLVLIGIVASAITWVLRLIASRGYNPKPEHVAIGLYVVSFALAVGFTALTFPAFPPFSDAPGFVFALLNWLGEILALAAPVVGIAYLIYNLLLKRVLEEVRARVAAAKS